MLILAYKNGHDGSIAVIRDGRLIMCVESEKDSFPRHQPTGPHALIRVAERLGEVPDIVASGGWHHRGGPRPRPIDAGYFGITEPIRRRGVWFGRELTWFSSSHERSHIFMAIGMAPGEEPDNQVVLVWEGDIGAFYRLDAGRRIVQTVPVLSQPGARYAALFAVSDPTFPDVGWIPRLEDAGKLMALAAFSSPTDATPDIVATIDEVMSIPNCYPVPKSLFRRSPIYNAGVEASSTKAAAALLSHRMFDRFAAAARETLPAGLPLRISGGCGLNCEWNRSWLDDPHFSSVFVPPCADDSGSAIGTAIDAQFCETGRAKLEWNVYSGVEFDMDVKPEAAGWRSSPLDFTRLAGVIAEGAIVAWVQGRCEIGPRALGNRSLLAEPFSPSTRDRLNAIKHREHYRPIAPCCRVEDLSAFSDDTFEDPYMLYFRRVRVASFGAVTHVDGSARVQTVSAESHPALYTLLSSFAERTGMGVLCNTSLNFKGHGFINRMSDLLVFCEGVGVQDFVVNGSWYRSSKLVSGGL